MFEQAVLSNGSTGRRMWMTSAGMLGEAIVITLAIAATLLWPEALPKVQSILVAPPAPVGMQTDQVKVQPKGATAPLRRVDLSKLIQPTAVAPHPQTLIEAPVPDPGAIPGSIAGPGVPGLPPGFLDALPAARSAAQPIERAKPLAKSPEPAQTIQRVRTGGIVDQPKLLHQVQPLYPSIARTAHVSGVVEITGVIGADGRVRELRVTHGHPLLTKAALDAVAQWLYEPTRLNGQIVEVITTITVNFKLDQ